MLIYVCQTLAGVVAMYWMLRLYQRVLKSIPTTWQVRLAISALVAYGTGVILGGYVFAPAGGSTGFAQAAVIYCIPIVIAAVMEAVRLYIQASRPNTTVEDERPS